MVRESVRGCAENFVTTLIRGVSDMTSAGPNRFRRANMGSAPHFTILNFNPQTMVHPIKDSSIDFCKDTPESVRRDTTSGSCMHVFIKSAQSKRVSFLEHEISTHSNPAGR